MSAALAADIDMTGRGWTPVCRLSSYSYTGTFDGGGHVISNLKIETSDYAGFFGNLSGTVKNLGLKNAEITASGTYTGGIAGYKYYGTITGCWVSGNVSCVSDGTGTYVGGITGYNDSGTIITITACYSTGDISGSTAGGIAGYSSSETYACYWESDSVEKGAGDGYDCSATKVDGSAVRWDEAQAAMNAKLGRTGYKYSGATTTTPPKLIKS